jgi:hypothetical protein
VRCHFGRLQIIPTITFANRSSAPDSADPSFQDYLQDQGQTKVFLQFGSLKNSMGTSRLSPIPPGFPKV